MTMNILAMWPNNVEQIVLIFFNYAYEYVEQI